MNPHEQSPYALQNDADKAARERREAPPRRPFTCPIQSNTSTVDVIAPIDLPRYALACWWSIAHLIRTCSPCYLWTFTMAKVYPDEWFGNMHMSLTCNVKNAARNSTGGKIPKNWGGVRVFEVHPGGHGLHAHWVLRGWMDWKTMQTCALRAGFGKVVHVDPEPIKIDAAYYLAKYLTKQDKIRGCRQWSNIGTYDGIGGRDIHITSERIERIKKSRQWYVAMGKHPYVAYQLALMDERERNDADCPF